MVKNLLNTFSFYLFTFILLLQTITDTDFGWHVAVGKFIFETKNIPYNDLFSFTLPDYHYIYHSWASYLVVFLSYKVAGFTGVSIFYSLVLTLSVFFLIKITKILYTDKPNLLLFLATTPLLQSIAGARPRAFSFLFFSIIYYLFLKFVNFKSKTVYLIPFVFFLWVNFHGSFFVGIATFTLCIIISAWLKTITTQQLKTLTKVLALSIFATLLNPYFIQALKQAISMSLNSSLRIQAVNSDWKPLISQATTGWILTALIILTALLIYKFKIKIITQEKLLLLIFFILSMLTARFTLPFLVFYIPTLHLLVVEARKRFKLAILELLPVKVALISFALVVILIALSNIYQIILTSSSMTNYSMLLQEKAPNRLAYASWPYESSQFVLDRFPDKNILCDANWSGYLLLLNPKVKVFYYGAMDNYFYNNTSFAYEYLNLINGKSKTEEILDKYKVDIVFLPPAYPVVKNLRTSNHWKIIMENSKAVVFVKN